jgi:hypothetical protein
MASFMDYSPLTGSDLTRRQATDGMLVVYDKPGPFLRRLCPSLPFKDRPDGQTGCCIEYKYLAVVAGVALFIDDPVVASKTFGHSIVGPEKLDAVLNCLKRNKLLKNESHSSMQLLMADVIHAASKLEDKTPLFLQDTDLCRTDRTRAALVTPAVEWVKDVKLGALVDEAGRAIPLAVLSWYAHPYFTREQRTETDGNFMRLLTHLCSGLVAIRPAAAGKVGDEFYEDLSCFIMETAWPPQLVRLPVIWMGRTRALDLLMQYSHNVQEEFKVDAVKRNLKSILPFYENLEKLFGSAMTSLDAFSLLHAFAVEVRGETFGLRLGSFDALLSLDSTAAPFVMMLTRDGKLHAEPSDKLQIIREYSLKEKATSKALSKVPAGGLEASGPKALGGSGSLPVSAAYHAQLVKYMHKDTHGLKVRLDELIASDASSDSILDAILHDQPNAIPYFQHILGGRIAGHENLSRLHSYRSDTKLMRYFVLAMKTDPDTGLVPENMEDLVMDERYVLGFMKGTTSWDLLDHGKKLCEPMLVAEAGAGDGAAFKPTFAADVFYYDPDRMSDLKRLLGVALQSVGIQDMGKRSFASFMDKGIRYAKAMQSLGPLTKEGTQSRLSKYMRKGLKEAWAEYVRMLADPSAEAKRCDAFLPKDNEAIPYITAKLLSLQKNIAARSDGILRLMMADERVHSQQRLTSSKRKSSAVTSDGEGADTLTVSVTGKKKKSKAKGDERSATRRLAKKAARKLNLGGAGKDHSSTGSAGSGSGLGAGGHSKKKSKTGAGGSVAPGSRASEVQVDKSANTLCFPNAKPYDLVKVDSALKAAHPAYKPGDVCYHKYLSIMSDDTSDCWCPTPNDPRHKGPRAEAHNFSKYEGVRGNIRTAQSFRRQ